MVRMSSRGVARAAGLACLCLAGTTVARAQGPAQEPNPLDIVVTATRTPQPIQRAGSAISVVTRDEIRRANPLSLADALRTVPGLNVTTTGGPGGTIDVRLRGANPGQTLVLIDGVRVNDPSQAAGEFDFALLPPDLIERIEVLRGPQSALYGSDAIGGVVNVITRRGRGAPQIGVRTEAGRYGTASGSASLSGSSGPWSYAFAGLGQRSDGFSNYGHRIGRIERRFPRLENDGFERFGGYGRIGYDTGEGVGLEAGMLSTTTFSDYDAAFGAFPDTPAFTERRFHQAWGRGSAQSFGGLLTHDLQVFANRTERTFRDVTYGANILPLNTTWTSSDFIGDRIGAEYQGGLRLGSFGSLTFGARLERETADTFSSVILPQPIPRRRDFAAEQTTRSGFALWQLPIGERLTLSLGGRIDDVLDVDRFATWRATAAYLIPEFGTKLRASAGTGAKAPSLFQLYASPFGNPALLPEESFGVDAGFDQILFDGRASLSVTAFANRFDNLIAFDFATSRYFNVAKAETSGIEVAADAEIWQDLLRLKAVYTYLDAKDRSTGLVLSRRPEHVARLSLAVTPAPRWSIEPVLVLVSERFSRAGEQDRLAPYARLDLYSEYRVDATWRVFGRLENVTNARYQEVLDYGAAGRAIYAGISATW